MPCAVYLRKSRADREAEARGEGETLARHEKALMELAARLGLDIAHIYREIVSGETLAARPQMQRLLADVEQGLWDGVLVMEVERLARGDTIDQGIVAQAFRYTSTKIITPVKIYDPLNEFDEEYFEFGLFMSRREYKTINRRLQRGRISSAKEGKYVASRPPYGYRKQKLEGDSGFTLQPHPEQAPVVKMIFELYTAGELQEDGSARRLGTGLIARRLNTLRIAPQRGTAWSASSIRDILINPVYIGKIRWNWRPGKKSMKGGVVAVTRPRAGEDGCLLSDGLHPPIVGPDVFAAAQEILSRRITRPVADRSALKSPLCGLIYCGKCGRLMVRRPPDRKKSPEGRDYLMCPAGCGNISAPLEEVEACLLEALDRWLAGYMPILTESTAEPASREKSGGRVLQEAEKRLEAELSGYRRQLGKAHELLEQGIYTPETFLERRRVLEELIGQAQANLGELRQQLGRQREHAMALQAAEGPEDGSYASLSSLYRQLDFPKAKNDLLRALTEKVVYRKEEKGRRNKPSDTFRLILFPRLPPFLSSEGR